ncbi:hypothetical protein [Geminicoccus flavidas]|uniref:hypothetical protein n=1 Tax=Geminicoccus flavidas TaxID=2506407 RepID=UPI0013570957|nr:hypothetical protein [Geminicoccus flavidas]
MNHPAHAGWQALQRFRATGAAEALVEAACSVIEGKQAAAPVQATLAERTDDLVLGDAYADTLLARLLLAERADDDDADSPFALPDQGEPGRCHPFVPAGLADKLFQNLADAEHPAVVIAGWLQVIFPTAAVEPRWTHHLKEIPDHASALAQDVVRRICAAPGGGGEEVAELVLIAAGLLEPSARDHLPRAPAAVARLDNVWREELPQAINAWAWSDDAFAGFLPVLEALLALPMEGEPEDGSDLIHARPHLLLEIANMVSRYDMDRRSRVIENWPPDQPLPVNFMSEKYPDGGYEVMSIDPAPEQIAARPAILAAARRFSAVVADAHHLACPLPRHLMRGLAADLRRFDASPRDVGWLFLLADQMVPDWDFNWLGDTTDWPDMDRHRHPATIRAPMLGDTIDEIRALGLDALADALTVWLLGTQVLFWDGDLGLPPARVRSLVLAITTRETTMRAALDRVVVACAEAAGRGSRHAAVYARLLQSLITPPKRSSLVALAGPR